MVISSQSNLFIAAFTILLIIKPVTALPCPNDCNAHGRCINPGRTCECFDGYTGPDCSLKYCPYGDAWADIPSGTDQAHYPAECSNMGLCDRNSGLCNCRTGFTGKACERLACPGSSAECNNVGKCQSMLYYALTKDPGLGTVYTYNATWDAEKIWGCNCDTAYFGPDCSKQKCPTGDDPLTGNGANTPSNPVQYNTIQKVSCKAASGTFTLSYKQQTTARIPWNAKAADLLSYLGALTTIGAGNVKIVMYGTQACVPAGTAFTVEFLQDFGPLPLIVPDGSNLAFSDSISKPFLLVAVTRGGTKENLFCSNRGTCDTSTGFCSCITNYQTSNGYAQPGIRGDCGAPLVTIAQCPGEVACSAHGVCSGSPTYVCSCATGWTGADCSERTCPTGVAWFTYPSSTDVAHVTESVECSSMGNCDRTAGTCTCMAGFSGQACEYMTCPGLSVECNGHGQCLDMATLATLSTVNGDKAGYTYGLIPNNPLTWDATMIFGCYCDPTYTGYDCSLRSCPYGDDPSTIDQVDQQETITCTDADLSGSIVFTFRQFSTSQLSPTTTSAQLTAALQALPSIGTVTVAPDTGSVDQLCSVTGNSLIVTFNTEHGLLPLLQKSLTKIDSLTVTITTVGTKENTECSGRGLCDRTLGTCQCFEGYGSSDGMGNQGSNGDCGYMESYSPIVAGQ